MADQFASIFHEETAPTAGAISPLNVTSTAASADLANLGPQTSSMINSDQLIGTGAAVGSAGLVGRRVSFTAVTANVGIVFGPTLLSVTSTNTPNLSNQGSNLVTGCYFIPAGQERKWIIHEATRFVGFVGSGNGTLVVAPISRAI